MTKLKPNQKIICQSDDHNGVDFIIISIPDEGQCRAIRITELRDLIVVRDSADRAIKSRLKQCEKIINRPDLDEGLARLRAKLSGEEVNRSLNFLGNEIKELMKLKKRNRAGLFLGKGGHLLFAIEKEIPGITVERVSTYAPEIPFRHTIGEKCLPKWPKWFKKAHWKATRHYPDLDRIFREIADRLELEWVEDRTCTVTKEDNFFCSGCDEVKAFVEKNYGRGLKGNFTNACIEALGRHVNNAGLRICPKEPGAIWESEYQGIKNRKITLE